MDRSIFERFHREFKGDTAVTFPICLACGGQCEYTAISSLLPGEAQYIADRVGEPLESFRNRYLDGVEMDGEVIDLIKCVARCPFLDAGDHSCAIRPFKPILCLIHPLVFEPNDQGWRFFVHDACPLSERAETRAYFEGEGRRLVERLHIPHEWLRRVYEYDQCTFDYDLMTAKRVRGVDEFQVFTLHELLSFQRTPLAAER